MGSCDGQRGVGQVVRGQHRGGDLADVRGFDRADPRVGGGYAVEIASGSLTTRSVPSGSRAWLGRVSVLFGIELLVLAAFAGAWLASSGALTGVSQHLLLLAAGCALGLQTTALRLIAVPGVTTTCFTGTVTGLLVGLEHRRRVDAPALTAVLALLVAATASGAGIFAVFLILWMQQVEGWTPIASGLAVLPMTACIALAAGVGSQLLGRSGPRPLLVTGPLVVAVDLLWLGLGPAPGSSYLTRVLPALVRIAPGTGLTFAALTNAAAAGMPPEDAGVTTTAARVGRGPLTILSGRAP